MIIHQGDVSMVNPIRDSLTSSNLCLSSVRGNVSKGLCFTSNNFLLLGRRFRPQVHPIFGMDWRASRCSPSPAFPTGSNTLYIILIFLLILSSSNNPVQTGSFKLTIVIISEYCIFSSRMTIWFFLG